MAVKVFIEGAVCDLADARISVFDRGFLYGDSVYEVMRTSGGHPVDFASHLDRLERSAAALALTPPSRVSIADACVMTMKAAENPESYLRIMVTRGKGEIGLDTALAGAPSLIVIVKPLALPPGRVYRDGMALRIVEVQRTARRAVDPAVKSGNYLNNIMALHEARRYGADEALMCNASGDVAEGSTCNVFAIRDGHVRTPALDAGLLPGITRQRVMDLARSDGIEVTEGRLRPDDFHHADEVFVTSSIRGVVPVGTIDGQSTRVPAIGPTTRRIMDLYGQYLDDVARNGTIPGADSR